MDIETQKAAGSFDHQGTRYYFCGKSCLEKFKADPNRFLQSGTPSDTRPAAVHPGVHAGVEYICPMDPEVRQSRPGACPKCGMALEPASVQLTGTSVEYTCPMHPEVVRSEPGPCPICGMALEPREVTGSEVNPELRDMRRRLAVGCVLTVPLLALMVLDMLPNGHWISNAAAGWIQLAFATPVVLWAGWPFFERGWASIRNRYFNMFTLIALGTGASYLFSVFALLFPAAIPASFRMHSGLDFIHQAA